MGQARQVPLPEVQGDFQQEAQNLRAEKDRQTQILTNLKSR
jgi:hypothetical protein